MDNFNFIPSFDENHKENQPLIIFSHIPKSAGTSFNSAIIAAYGQKGINNHLVGRIYSSNLIEIKEKVSNAILNGMTISGFISSTIPNETVSTLGVPIRPVTLIRDATDRVISHYCYQCMREKKTPNLNNLKAFYREKENQNVSCKILMGKNNIIYGDGEKCFNILNQFYYAYCSIDKINTLIMSILSTEGLPNVIMAKENYTLSKYKIRDIPEGLIQEIKYLNEEDHKLYRLVYSNPKIPNPTNKNSINGNSIKITCTQTEEQYKGIVESFLTTELGNHVNKVEVIL